jgi:hypothetical protein
MLRAFLFLCLASAALGSEKLDVLVNAAASFSATIQQQLETLQSDPSPEEIADKTVDYSEAKMAYFNALSAEMPEAMTIAKGEATRHSELDLFAAAFAVADEDQEKTADNETAVLLKQYSGNPDVEKAKVEFRRAKAVEEKFHRDYDEFNIN